MGPPGPDPDFSEPSDEQSILEGWTSQWCCATHAVLESPALDGAIGRLALASLRSLLPPAICLLRSPVAGTAELALGAWIVARLLSAAAARAEQGGATAEQREALCITQLEALPAYVVALGHAVPSCGEGLLVKRNGMLEALGGLTQLAAGALRSVQSQSGSLHHQQRALAAAEALLRASCLEQRWMPHLAQLRHGSAAQQELTPSEPAWALDAAQLLETCTGGSAGLLVPEALPAQSQRQLLRTAVSLGKAVHWAATAEQGAALGPALARWLLALDVAASQLEAREEGSKEQRLVDCLQLTLAAAAGALAQQQQQENSPAVHELAAALASRLTWA